MDRKHLAEQRKLGNVAYEIIELYAFLPKMNMLNPTLRNYLQVGPRE